DRIATASLRTRFIPLHRRRQRRHQENGGNRLLPKSPRSRPPATFSSYSSLPALADRHRLTLGPREEFLHTFRSKNLDARGGWQWRLHGVEARGARSRWRPRWGSPPLRSRGCAPECLVPVRSRRLVAVR
ncbi:unnamed protein product, partial [Musa acuminata subsp. burmannicoides]